MNASPNETREQRDTPTRRSVLKSAGSLGVVTLGLGGTPDLTAADPSKFKRGTVHFVEVKAEYPNAPSGPKGERHGTASYVVEPSKKRLTLTNASVETFTSHPTVVAADGEFYQSGMSFPVTKSKSHIPIKSDYRRLQSEYLRLGEKRTVLEASVVETNGAVRLATDDTEMRVENGRETEFTNRTVSVTPSGSDEPASLEQRITVRNHGRVTLFAHEDYVVLPLASEDPYARARTDSLVALAKDHASKVENADLLAVPKDAQFDANGGGQE